MRRIQVILAVIAAVTTMMALAAPAMAQTEFTPGTIEFGDDVTVVGNAGVVVGPDALGVGSIDDGDGDFFFFPGLVGDVDFGDGSESIQFVESLDSGVGSIDFA